METKKTAVVTGASRGIGKAIALRLAKDGYQVVINYNASGEAAEEVAREIIQAGGAALTVQADVGNFQEAKKLMDAAMEAYGRIDVLVNNAGITKDNIMARMKEEEFDQVLQTNLKSAFNCARHATPVMMKQRSGCIINISSVSGLMGNAGQANYSASKAGMIGLTKALARELAGRNIRANAVAPGVIETSMTQKLPEEVKEKLSAQIPQKRLGQPEDVANAVAFLASAQAAYITGQVIAVDGGMTI